MLFTNNEVLARDAAAAGVDRIVIDLERRGKWRRQHGYHLERNDHTVGDIARVKKANIPVVCRINPIFHGTPNEVERALDGGADILMLPMFRATREVERLLNLVKGRALTSLLFETREAVEIAPDLVNAGMDEVYVGLNDLRLSYGVPFPYQLLTDGTVDRVRACFPDKPFGFGGITVLDRGSPLPTKQIIQELARLRATHVIVRRAFKRDIVGRDLREEVARIKAYYVECRRRPQEIVEHDRVQVMCAVNDIVNRRQAEKNRAFILQVLQSLMSKAPLLERGMRRVARALWGRTS